jgi:signal transduction histidine kinase
VRWKPGVLVCLVATVALSGIAVAVAVAVAGRMGVGSALTLLGWTFGGAVGSIALALVLLWILRRRPATVQVTIASLAPVVAVAAGVAGGSWAMFISGEDLRALVVILVGACTVGTTTALVLGNRVHRASAGLGELARRIGNVSEPADPTLSDRPREAAGRSTGSTGSTGRTGRVARPEAGGAEVAYGSGPEELARLAEELQAALVRLAESRAQAASLEQSRRELVAWVSHDLRTPLAGIRAMVEALQDGVVSDAETIDRYHETIAVEVGRLSSLVGELFELSRIHAGALHLSPAPARLEEALSEVVERADLLGGAKGVSVCSSVSGSPVANLSVPELGRAVENLVDNAIRHTPEGGSIRIDLGEDASDRSAWVSVADGCGGIPEGDLGRVFDLGFSGDAARSPQDGRAGLGLAVARGLVEAQGGRLSVTNGDEGCCFKITLDLSGDPALLDASRRPDRTGVPPEPAATALATPLEQVL